MTDAKEILKRLFPTKPKCPCCSLPISMSPRAFLSHGNTFCSQACAQVHWMRSKMSTQPERPEQE